MNLRIFDFELQMKFKKMKNVEETQFWSFMYN